MLNDDASMPAARARPIAKWRSAAITGWQPLPDVLLKSQAKLGLSATDMLVLINILSHWWYVEHRPYPRVSTISKRMDVTVRTVQRSVEKLINKGLLARRREAHGPGGEVRDVLDPEGLVKVLEEVATTDPAYHYKRQLEDGGGPQNAPF